VSDHARSTHLAGSRSTSAATHAPTGFPIEITIGASARVIPSRAQVEGLERGGPPARPTWSVALGAATWRRWIANLGAAPAFGGVVGQFYRVTTSLGLIVFWSLGGVLLASHAPLALALSCFIASAFYAAIQPLLGVWARATLRPGRIEARNVPTDTDLGRIIAAYARVSALSGSSHARVALPELRRSIWEAILLAERPDDAARSALSSLRDAVEGSAAVLEARVYGRRNEVPVAA
jgi:hypothetical protein